METTLAQHVSWHVVRESVRLGRARVEVKDRYLSARVGDALLQLSFRLERDSFLKRNALGLLNMNALEALVAGDATDRGLLTSADSRPEAMAAVSRRQVFLETTLWPAKASNGALPSYLVPIRPSWAMQLFDEPLSESDLFGAEPMLLLQSENVYYRASRPAVPEAPSRVIWYVSNVSGVARSKHAVGCSLVTNVVVGPAKDVFKRFHRLGAFRWADVLKVARSDPSKEILAFTFGHTDLFRNPIPWPVLKHLLKEHGLAGLTLQGPVRISEPLFAAIYGRGCA